MSSPLLASGKAVSRVSNPSPCQTQRGLQAPQRQAGSSVSLPGSLMILGAGSQRPCVLMSEDTPCVAAWRPARSELERSKLPQAPPKNGRLGKCFCRRLVIISPAERSSHPRPCLTAQSRDSAGCTIRISRWRQKGHRAGPWGFESVLGPPADAASISGNAVQLSTSPSPFIP